ncbi:MAG: MMPL family transporter [Pseudomonadota bacterium]
MDGSGTGGGEKLPPDDPPGQIADTGASRFTRQLAAGVVAWRRVVIGISVILCAFLSVGLLNWKVTGDARIFFGKDNPELQALERLEATYAKLNSVVFVVAPTEGDLFTEAALSAVLELTRESWLLPHVVRVESLSEYRVIEGDSDSIAVRPLFEPDDTFDAPRLATIREETMAEDAILGRLISNDGRVTSVVALVTLPGDKATVRRLSAISRELAERVEAAYPGIDIRLTGGVIADDTFAAAGERDKNSLFPIAGFLVVVMLLILLRSIPMTVAVVAVLGATIASGVGLAALFGASFNAATTAAPVAILVLALASAFHVLIGAAHAARKGLDPAAAMVRSLEENIVPVSAASITTVIGFLSLNFSDSPPLREMGNIIAYGVLFSWGFCLTLLPALFSYLPPVRPFAFAGLEGLLDRIARFSTRQRRAVLLASLVVLPVALLGAARIVPDDNFVKYFDETYQFRQDTDFFERSLAGLNVIHFALRAGDEPDSVYDPDFLRRVDRFAEWLEEQPEVAHTSAITDTIKSLNQALEAGREEYFRIGETAEKNAQALFFYELSLPPGHDLNSFLSIDRSETKLSAFVPAVSSRQILEIGERGQAWLEANEPGIAVPATGLSIAFAYVSSRNIEGMIVGTLAALVLVSFVMLLIFRSWRLGAVSLAPNIVPGLLAFGLWGYLIGQINLSATVVSAMTFGIIVDDTIHLVMRYRQARLAGQSAEEAVRYSLTTAGLAITLTTFAIVLGFAVLTLSGFQLTRFLGGLSGLVVLFALIADALLLAALLATVDRKGRLTRD